jgi:hypothetical protein
VGEVLYRKNKLNLNIFHHLHRSLHVFVCTFSIFKATVRTKLCLFYCFTFSITLMSIDWLFVIKVVKLQNE